MLPRSTQASAAEPLMRQQEQEAARDLNLCLASGQQCSASGSGGRMPAEPAPIAWPFAGSAASEWHFRANVATNTSMSGITVPHAVKMLSRSSYVQDCSKWHPRGADIRQSSGPGRLRCYTLCSGEFAADTVRMRFQ
jgi:hypothetical protein